MNDARPDVISCVLILHDHVEYVANAGAMHPMKHGAAEAEPLLVKRRNNLDMMIVERT